MAEFTLKQRLQQGAPFSLGFTSVELSETQLREYLQDNPCDMIFVDLQHAPYSEAQVVSFCAAAAAAGAPALVRLRHPRLVCEIGRFLDFGAGGVVVPMTERPETVEEALEGFYYPPRGGRSVGLRFAYGWGEIGDVPTYADWWNEHGILALQIETVAAVRAVRSLALPGVDLLLFGGTDLGLSLAAHPDCPWLTVADCQGQVVAETADLPVRVGVSDVPFGRFA